MTKFKNYMVMEIIENGTLEDWCIGEFDKEEEAVSFAKAYTLERRQSPRDDGEVVKIEVWGTDEDPDTFTSCSTVYSRNLKDNKPTLAERILSLVDPWERDEVNLASIEKAIKEDPASVIEMLLNTIEDYNAIIPNNFEA